MTKPGTIAARPLTPEEIAAMKKSRIVIAILAVLFGLMTAPALAGLVYGFVSGRYPLAYGMIVVLAVMIPVDAVMTVLLSRYSRDLREKTANVIRGKIEKKYTARGWGFVVLGGKRFSVDSRAYGKFLPGFEAELHYSRHAKHLLLLSYSGDGKDISLL